MGYLVGVDIGGTFTDCCVLSDDGTGILSKYPSTPPDFDEGFVEALRAAAARWGIAVEDLLARADGIYHGCTVGTNALVERRTSCVGLLVTAGHTETVFVMGAGGRLRGLPAHEIAHVAAHDKPEPLVPRRLVRPVHERVAFDGNEIVPLNADATRAAIRELLEAGAESFAVSLLWSVVNPQHELVVRDLLAQEAPGAFVSLSHEVVPRVGEYERTVATVINAAIGPVMSTYLRRLETRLAQLGYTAGLRVMSCSGGLLGLELCRRLPILTVGSGPAAGVIGAQRLQQSAASGTVAARGDVVTADMGGTTLDVGVILRSEPLSRPITRLGQYEYYVPTLDIRSVGAGGGSIVRFDPVSRTLKVGPRSAGARPGPAAYRRGGTEPTVTDADLVLGYLDPNLQIGPDLRLDIDAARAALERVGALLGLDAEQAAAATARVVDNQMADTIRLVSVNQGYDPRTFVMCAYGGNGPLHGPAIASHLGIGVVVVPLRGHASGWSAFGVSASEPLVVRQAPCPMRYPFDTDVLNSLWERLEAEVVNQLDARPNDVRIERLAELRYTTQVSQVVVTAPGGVWTAREADQLVEQFECEYERLFGEGTGYARAGFTLTSVSVRGRGAGRKFSAPARDSEVRRATDPREMGRRAVIWYEQGLDRVPTPVFDGESLSPTTDVAGPALIDCGTTTIAVRPGQRARLDVQGSVLVELTTSVRAS